MNRKKAKRIWKEMGGHVPRTEKAKKRLQGLSRVPVPVGTVAILDSEKKKRLFPAGRGGPRVPLGNVSDPHIFMRLKRNLSGICSLIMRIPLGI